MFERVTWAELSVRDVSGDMVVGDCLVFLVRWGGGMGVWCGCLMWMCDVDVIWMV